MLIAAEDYFQGIQCYEGWAKADCFSESHVIIIGVVFS